MAGKRPTGTASDIPSRTLSLAEAFEALQQEFNPLDTPPDGFYTMQQIAEQWGRSLSVVSSYVRKGMAVGKVECKRYRVKTGGKIYAAPHYRFHA